MNTPFEVWMQKLASITPHATGLIFDWCVSTASCELEPRVRESKLGDGYTQRRPAGINTQDQLWSVQLNNLTERKAGDVLDFLSARNGVDVFNWTPPRTSIVLDVICPSWSWAYGEMTLDGARVMNVTAKFQQVHV